jgi:N-acetylglutamate synthase-like GNAT family acetyltransferase
MNPEPDPMHLADITPITDETEIQPLLTKYYDQPTLDLLKRNFKLKDSYYLIARQNNTFVGFCSIDRDWWEDNYFFIREILVEPNFQKQGIGETIMGMCIEHAKKMAATGVVTETAFENEPMQKLCAKFPFKKWENPKWKEGITFKLMF